MEKFMRERKQQPCDEDKKAIEECVNTLEKEMTKRRQVIDMLEEGTKFYDSLQGEAKDIAKVTHLRY